MSIFDTRYLTTAEKIEIGAMSTICPHKAGYGVILIIFSSEHNPPHFHVFKAASGRRCLCRYVLTLDRPKSVQDLIPLKGDTDLPRRDKAAIVEWAKAQYKDTNYTNWKHAQYTWEDEADTDIEMEFPTIRDAKDGKIYQKKSPTAKG